MKDTGLLPDYIYWMKYDPLYKYGGEMFIPTYIVHLAIWHFFSNIGQLRLTIVTYVLHLSISFFWLITKYKSAKPYKKRVGVPIFSSFAFLIISLIIFYFCMFPVINGPYSDFAWGTESRLPYSWSFMMYGCFYSALTSTGFLLAAIANIKKKTNSFTYT